MCGPLLYWITRNSKKTFCNLSCRESALSGARTVIHVTLITKTETVWEYLWQVCLKACMQTVECPERSDSVRLDTMDREKSEDTATTLMRRRLMSCWSAERKPWLILGKTIWAGVWGQEVGGQRWEKVEGGWGPRRRRRKRKANAKRNRVVRKACVHQPRAAPSQTGGEIHKSTLFQLRGGLLRKSGLSFFLGARAHNYHLRGARAPQRAHGPLKNGNFSSSVKALSSSSLRLLLSRTPRAAHTEAGVLDLLSRGWFQNRVPSQCMHYSARVHWY